MSPKEILQSEGFLHIYEWHDEPGTLYSKHAHKGKVSIFIENGEVEFTFSDGIKNILYAGDQFHVPIGIEHTAKVGQQGCDYIIGEMIKGDS